MGAQPGQYGQNGGIPPQQAGMQPQGMGAPGETARLSFTFFKSSSEMAHVSTLQAVACVPHPAGWLAGWLLHNFSILICDMQAGLSCKAVTCCSLPATCASSIGNIQLLLAKLVPGQTTAEQQACSIVTRSSHKSCMPAGAGGNNVQKLQSKLQQIIQMNQLQGFYPPGGQQFNKALQSVSRVDFR